MKFREIRRQDRLLDTDSMRRLLETGQYGFLAMVSPEGYGYGLPLNFVADGNRLYFHCAPQGHKLDAVRLNDRVSFCVVGNTRVLPRQFTTAYESVHVFGRIRIVADDEERYRALRLLVGKYAPEHVEVSEKYIKASFHRTAVLCLEIEHGSGKCKRVGV